MKVLDQYDIIGNAVTLLVLVVDLCVVVEEEVGI